MNNNLHLVICGCGALGSRIGYEIAHLPWQSITLIDDDVVEENNIPTSAYSVVHHLGMRKVSALANMMYLRYDIPLKRHIAEMGETLDLPIHSILDAFQNWLVLDCFDNSSARWLTVEGMPPRSYYDTLHIGVAAELSGAVIWDEKYIVPDGPPRGESPVCTNELGFDIIQKTSALAVSIINRYMTTGEKVSATISGFSTQII